jgi:hypothetical protein
MRDRRALAAAGTTMAIRRPFATASAERLRPSFWRFGRWFGRKKPTLYQRCLAVHIHHASPQTSLH